MNGGKPVTPEDLERWRINRESTKLILKSIPDSAKGAKDNTIYVNFKTRKRYKTKRYWDKHVEKIKTKKFDKKRKAS